MEKLELLYFEKKESKDGLRGVVNVFTHLNDDYVGVFYYFKEDNKIGFLVNSFATPSDSVIKELLTYRDELENYLNPEIEFKADFKLDLGFVIDKNPPTEN